MKDLERQLKHYIYQKPRTRVIARIQRASGIINEVDGELIVHKNWAGRFINLKTRKTEYNLPKETNPTINRVGNDYFVLGWDDRTFYDLRTGEVVTRFPSKMSEVINEVDGQYLVKRKARDDKSFLDFHTKKVALRWWKKNLPHQLDSRIIKFRDQYLVLCSDTDFYDFHKKKPVAKMPSAVLPYIHFINGKLLIQGRNQFYYFESGKEAFKIDTLSYWPIFNDKGHYIFRGDNNTFRELFFEKMIRDCPLEKVIKSLEK